MTKVVASLPDGTRFDFVVHSGTDQFISQRIKNRGSWEPFETGIMISLLRPGDVFIDIGANIGWYTVMSALTVGRSGHVFAFEPAGDNADLLERNVALNRLDNVKLFRCALAESTGAMQFVRSPTNMGDHRVVSSTGAVGATTVAVDTLDRLVACSEVELAKARIVKIDTQGAELFVLKGAQNAFMGLRDECAIFIEFSPNLLRMHDSGASESFLQMLGKLARNIYVINSRFRTIHPISNDELRGFAASCSGASEDVGLDLILAPRDDSQLRRFRRPYQLLLKPRFLRRRAGGTAGRTADR